MSMLGGFRSAFVGTVASCAFGAVVLGLMISVRSWGTPTLGYAVVAVGLIAAAVAFGFWSYLASGVLDESR